MVGEGVFPFPNGEVRLVVLQPSEPDPDGPPDVQHAKVVAVAYDSSKGPLEGGRQLAKEEAGDSLDDYVALVMHDMDLVGRQLVTTYAKELHDGEIGLTTVYTELMAHWRNMPLEVLCNMLASVLVECVEEIAQDPDYDKYMKQFGEPS